MCSDAFRENQALSLDNRGQRWKVAAAPRDSEATTAFRFFLNSSITPTPMSYPVKLRLTGVVVDTPELTFTRSGAPRIAFTVIVRGIAARRRHHVVAYGSVASFCERYVVPGQRLHVEGTSLPKQRFPRGVGTADYEAMVLAQNVREVQRKVRATRAPLPALAAAVQQEALPTAPATPTTPAAAQLALTA